MAKILIAEDDGSMLDVFSTAVEALGMCVIRAANGRIAWEILNGNPDMDLIICDMSMPELDGRQLIARIKADARLCAMPVLVVSGVLRAREIATLLEQGVSQFMAKPVNLQELAEAVKRLTP